MNCVLCMQPGGDPLSGGYCTSCRPFAVTVNIGPAVLVARDISRAFPRDDEES